MRNYAIEPSELIARLDEKFQRKAALARQKRQAKTLRNSLAHFRGAHVDSIDDEIILDPMIRYEL